MLGQDVVSVLSHERYEFSSVRYVNWLAPNMGIGIACAVPIEVISAIAPRKSFVFTNDRYRIFALANFANFKTSTKWQLPTDIWLCINKVTVFFFR